MRIECISSDFRHDLCLSPRERANFACGEIDTNHHFSTVCTKVWKGMVIKMSKIIHTSNAPEAIGPYSQAVACGNLVFTSGQIAINPANGTIEADTIEAQTEQVCKNLKAVLEESGSSLEKVIKTVCFLRNMSDFAAFNEVYGKYFIGKPARSCVAVRELPKNVLVEIDTVAEI